MVTVARRGFRYLPGAALAISALAIPLSGCSDSDDEADCSPPGPAPAAEMSLLPEGLSLDGVGTVTAVEHDEGEVEIRAVSTKPLDELTVLIQDAVTAAGYSPAGMDNEGDEAEVFFESGSFAAGQAELRESDCEARWDIELVLIDLDRLTDPAPEG